VEVANGLTRNLAIWAVTATVSSTGNILFDPAFSGCFHGLPVWKALAYVVWTRSNDHFAEMCPL